MQAIVCDQIGTQQINWVHFWQNKKYVGWRQQARRLIVFSTDASFHYAGDGKVK